MKSCTRIVVLIFTLNAAAVPLGAITAAAAEKSPFDDAVAVWHMADRKDAPKNRCPLKIVGQVKLGAGLSQAETEQSLRRGGDGKVAVFSGGHLVAGSKSGEPLRLDGKAMTFYMRLRDPLGKWDVPLFSRDDKDDKLSGVLYGADGYAKPHNYLIGGPGHERPTAPTPFYHLFAEKGEPRAIDGTRALLEYRWRTEPVEIITGRAGGMAGLLADETANAFLPLDVPVAMLGPRQWHDVIVRFAGPKVEMFVDGVLVDEEWPFGAIYKFESPWLIGAGYEDAQLKTGFRGLVDHVALWNRALDDKEIVQLSGGKERVAQRDAEILGEEQASPQYWRPRGYNAYAGDCMCLFEDGVFHLFYLFDRRQHTSKWLLGAHQYAHLTTKDLVHWEHQPMAVPISRQWESAMGTGDFLFHDGTYYAFYTDCGSRCEFPGKPHKGNGIFMATSTDGIHFTKQLEPVVPGGDCTIFRDDATGLFHLCTPSWTIGQSGGLVDYVSTDLKEWKLQEGRLLDRAGCCPHHFRFNDWYYLTVDGLFWKSRSATGPWTPLRPHRLSVLLYPKTAGFTGNRRLAAGWIPDGGWGGDLVLFEMVQREDGSLDTKFVPELIPASGEPLKLPFGKVVDKVSGGAESVELDASQGFAAGMFSDVPQDARITLEVCPGPGATAFGLCLRGSGKYEDGIELQFRPAEQRVQFGKPQQGTLGPQSDPAIGQVDGLDHPFQLDIVATGTLIDVCIDNRRTLIARRKDADGDRLFFFAKDGPVKFKDIQVRPLVRDSLP
jgi:hypothetical protein